MEEKQLINIKFYSEYDLADKNYYVESSENSKNLNFMKCCDMLKLKDYKMFHILLKKEYWEMDNSVMIVDTIKSDDVEHFKYILQYIGLLNIKQVLNYSCLINSENIALYILKNNYHLWEGPQQTNGHYIWFYLLCDPYLPTSKLFKKYGKYAKEKNEYGAMQYVAEHNNLESIKWLYSRGYPTSKGIFYIAMENKNIEIIDWIIDNKANDHTENEFTIDGKNPDMKFYKLLLKRGFTLSRDPVHYAYACDTKDIQYVQLLLDHNCPFDRRVMDFAAHSGLIDIIKLLAGSGGELGGSVCDSAVNNNNLATLKYLRGEREEKTDEIIRICPLDSFCFNQCMDKNNIEILNYLIKEKCPWDEDTFYHAFSMYHNEELPVDDCIKIMKILLTNGCPFNTSHISDEIVERLDIDIKGLELVQLKKDELKIKEKIRLIEEEIKNRC